LLRLVKTRLAFRNLWSAFAWLAHKSPSLNMLPWNDWDALGLCAPLGHQASSLSSPKHGDLEKQAGTARRWRKTLKGDGSGAAPDRYPAHRSLIFCNIS
jgi:hypothetical protein